MSPRERWDSVGVSRVTPELNKRLGQVLRTQHWPRLATGMGREGVGTLGTQRKGVRPPARGAVQRGRLCSPPCPHLLFLCQISNYLTVPAHKLDSPTMSRARIGSGKAGHGGPGKGPRGWAQASESLQGGRASHRPSRELLLCQVELGVHQRGAPQKSGPAVLPRERVLHGGGSR